jgi:hypothetical protein
MTSLNSLSSLLRGSNSYNPYTTSLGALDYSSSLYNDDSSLASLYGGTDYANLGYSSNTLNTRLARENAYLKAQLEEYKDAAENRKGFLGFPVLGADSKGNGGVDTGSGIVAGLAGFLLPKLLGGGKNKDGGGFLGGLFG